jgi:poly-beta-hydroxyalkanoate depolymerase
MYLLKIQNIFKQKNIQLARAFTILHLYAKKDRKNINLLPLLNIGGKEEDILTIGNTYGFLLKNFSNRDSKNEINSFYFELLENQ